MTSATTIIEDAYQYCNVVGDEQDPSGVQGTNGLRMLNQILEQWSLMPLTIPVIAREVFALVSGQGGPSAPYTIGPGGDFDTTRPTSINSVGLLDTSNPSAPFEITRTIYTEDAYASITQKELQSNYFAGMRYEASSVDGRGEIFLYPVPNVDTTSIVLYRPMQLRQFTSLADAYDFPPGAVSALTFELAVWVATRYARGQVPGLETLRDKALAVYQRGNTVMTDLGLDGALTPNAGVFDITSYSINGLS